MGFSSRRFKSFKSANNFALRVYGTVRDISQGKPGQPNYKQSFKVVFETKGQSVIALKVNTKYQKAYRDDYDFDGYTHTSDDI